MGDFRASEGIAEGEIRPIQWDGSGDTVTKNAHMIGLNSGIRESLLEYCDFMGITAIMKELTIGSRYLQPQEGDIDIRLQGFDWYIQRVDASSWKSDMHWMSPSDATAQQNYLEALSKAGFDEVLTSVGTHFGFKGLAAYHLSFIAVTHCQPGHIHVDATNSGARVLNVIIPLILSDETGPELNLRSDEEPTKKLGGFKYQYNVAALIGDDAFHGTAQVDYRSHDGLRMAATVYIADIGEDNIEAVTSDYVTYAQAYPPPGKPEILLTYAGKHWHPTISSNKLPQASKE